MLSNQLLISDNQTTIGNRNQAKIDLMLHKDKNETLSRKEMAQAEDLYEAGKVSDEAIEELRRRYRKTKETERDVFDR